MKYAPALRPRCVRVSRTEKSKTLDEFIQVTGFHRKAVIRLLDRGSRRAPGERRGGRGK